MKEELSISLVQYDIAWENCGKNLKKLDTLIGDLKNTPDIILLPETFNTGFTMRSTDFAEDMDGETVSWMKEKARQTDAAICGSIIIKEGSRYYNRFLWIEDGKTPIVYDKRHLFRMGNEDQSFSPGSKRLIIDYEGWKIMPLICYDLRFPVWSRNDSMYDLLIYVANWPAARQKVWEIITQARAIENQTWLAGVNRIGTDGQGIEYKGGTCIINPKGEYELNDHSRSEKVLTGVLSYKEMAQFRAKFPVWKDADRFEIK